MLADFSCWDCRYCSPADCHLLLTKLSRSSKVFCSVTYWNLNFVLLKKSQHHGMLHAALSTCVQLQIQSQLYFLPLCLCGYPHTPSNQNKFFSFNWLETGWRWRESIWTKKLNFLLLVLLAFYIGKKKCNPSFLGHLCSHLCSGTPCYAQTDSVSRIYKTLKYNTVIYWLIQTRDSWTLMCYQGKH